METIRSVNNDRVKQWSKLLKKKGREESRNFLLEGLTSILEAIRCGGKIETILILEDYRIETKDHDEIDIIMKTFNEKKQMLPDIFIVSEQVLHKLTETITPQGIIAVVEQPKFKIESLSH
ncbi:MAG: RNA methyltransferase substrate-binding domain-containing protein, partial [Bacilli bacterium]